MTSHPSVVTLVAQTRAALAGSARDRLGARTTPRTVLGIGIGRASRIVPGAEVWHLGVLLIGDDTVYATGRVLRARQEAIRGFTATSQRERAELAAAARRGGFAEGETVHLDWTVLDPGVVDAGGSSGPLLALDGEPHVRWSASGQSRPLSAYLAEQLSLR